MSWTGKAVGIAVGAFLGEGVGAAVGGFVGHLFDERKVGNNEEAQALTAMFALYVSAAQANGTISDAERSRLTTIGRQLFGGAPDSEITELILTFERQPLNVENCAGILQHLNMNPDGLFVVARDVFSVLYADGGMDPNEAEWVGQMAGVSNPDPWTYASWFYQRPDLDAMRTETLRMLDLPVGASDAQIKDAYRKCCKQYHPDTLAGVPDPLKKLAEEKLQQINQAYAFLTNPTAMLDELFVRGDSGNWNRASTVTPGTISCCPLCEQRNRIPSAEKLWVTRCGNCHGLLAIPAELQPA